MKKPICVLIGMGPGISYSTARLFGLKGYKIVMVSRKEEKLNSLAEEFNSEDIDAVYYISDASDFENLRSSLNQIHSDLGIPDVLVYNVSVYRESSPTQLAAEDVIDDFKSNVGGALVAVQSFVDGMKERGSGTIFLTGGGQGLEPMHILSSLGIGKAAMRNLSFSLYKELEPFKIKVATVTVDGMVAKDTPFDPDIIAQHYWELHNATDGDFQREIIIS